MNDKNLVIPLHDQPVEIGARTETQLDWTVPAGWQTEVLRLEEGTQIPVSVAITTIDDGVVVEASGFASLKGKCIRCLKDIELPEHFQASDIFVYPDAVAPRKERKGAGDATIEVSGDEIDPDLLIDRETVNIEPLLRDAIFADAPFQPVCSEDCLGICEHCGVLLADAEPGHRHEFLDPRFEVLADFFSKDEVDDEGAE